MNMKTNGYIIPGPKTEHLWEKIRLAKASGDREEVGRLTQEIRKVSVDLIRAGELEYGDQSKTNQVTPTQSV